MLGRRFYDGSELDVMTAHVAKELIEVVGMVGIQPVHHGHRVPLHAIAVEALNALHDTLEGAPVLPVAAVGIVEALRSVDGNAHQPVVVFQEPAPLIGEQCAIGLQAVVDEMAVGIFLLQLQGFLIE